MKAGICGWCSLIGRSAIGVEELPLQIGRYGSSVSPSCATGGGSA
jgi:hypothetical protein